LARREASQPSMLKPPPRQIECVTISPRPAYERGHANHGWPDSCHGFSFADYRDPQGVQWGPLWVINEDRAAAFQGFGTYGHRDPCRICAITNGVLAERAEWRNFVEYLGVSCEFLHRNQFRSRLPDVAVLLPAVFRIVDGQPRVCAKADALNVCSGLPDLEASICRGSAGLGRSDARAGYELEPF
jgi:hypothetical protein